METSSTLSQVETSSTLPPEENSNTGNFYTPAGLIGNLQHSRTPTGSKTKYYFGSMFVVENSPAKVMVAALLRVLIQANK